MSNTPEKEIRELNENLVKLNKRFGSPWIALGKGFIGGLGSVLGAGLAIILIGWFLNVIGVIPAFQRQADQWREVFDQTSAQSIISPSGSTGVTE
ncbi:TPA: hypothetical protein DCG61_02305 [Patescibacteria group bacterium]|jgi:hypothetical protein|nr:hypothetical protein [Patescibacteria group bacterium]